MKKSEIFREIMSIVCDCAEVNENDLLTPTKRSEEISSARTVIIGLSKEYGLSNKQIQQSLRLRGHRSIYYHSSQFDVLSKNSRPFRYLLASVRHELDKTFPTM